MTNVFDILKKYGLEVPEDKRADFEKEHAANYKTVAEYEKKLGKLESDRDGLQTQLTAAQDALKGFDGIDVKDIQSKLQEAERKIQEAETRRQTELAARDFDDALREALEAYKFSSGAAKSAVASEIRSKGLKLENGKILGLNDLMDAIKARDAGAFVNEENPPAKITSAMSPKTGGTKYKDKAEIMKIKDASERQKAIADNIDLFMKG